MTIKETLKLAWENRKQITDAFYNKYIEIKPEIQAEAARRKAICESNVCGHYDPLGKPETSVIKGEPACDICHCNIDNKVMCTICYCALKDIEREPLWTEMFDEVIDKEIREIEYQNQFKNRK
jgi:hypothetical protein